MFATFNSNNFIKIINYFDINSLFKNGENGWYYSNDPNFFRTNSNSIPKNNEQINSIIDQINTNNASYYSSRPIYKDENNDQYIQFTGSQYLVNQCNFTSPATLAFVVNGDNFHNSAYGAMPIGGIGSFFGAGTGYGLSFTNNGDNVHSQIRKNNTINQMVSVQGQWTSKKILILVVFGEETITLHVNNFSTIQQYSLGSGTTPDNRFSIGGLYSNSNTQRFKGKLYASFGIARELRNSEVESLKMRLMQDFSIT